MSKQGFYAVARKIGEKTKTVELHSVPSYIQFSVIFLVNPFLSMDKVHYERPSIQN